jgi:hypothetical protein
MSEDVGQLVGLDNQFANLPPYYYTSEGEVRCQENGKLQSV